MSERYNGNAKDFELNRRFDAIEHSIEHLSTNVSETKEVMKRLGENSENLKSLPEICEKMSSIHTDLLAAATGRRQVPIAVFIIVVLVFSLIPLIDRLGDRGLGLKVHSGGVEITDRENR